MSNEVYGYIEYVEKKYRAGLWTHLETETGIGFTPITASELYNFPPDLLPTDETALCFLIGDKPGKKDATYLIDCTDYSPEAEIGLPNSGKARLELLVLALKRIILVDKPSRLVVALSDSSQIEERKEVVLTDLLTTIIKDCEAYSPPDCVYDILL